MWFNDVTAPHVYWVAMTSFCLCLMRGTISVQNAVNLIIPANCRVRYFVSRNSHCLRI